MDSAQRAYQPDRMGQRHDFSNGQEDFGQIIDRKYHAGKEKHRREDAGEVKIELINGLHKGRDQQRDRGEHHARQKPYQRDKDARGKRNDPKQ